MPQDLGTIFYFDWELKFLHFLQSIHNPVLDSIMLFFTNSSNIITILILISIVYPKTRRIGIQMILAILLSQILINNELKHLFTRCRPCWLEPGVKLLVDYPNSYSFPSGHTTGFFTLATAVFLSNKKLGIPALVFASLGAFSRLYLFVHWPTDILGGILSGALCGVLSYLIIEAFIRFLKKKILTEK